MTTQNYYSLMKKQLYFMLTLALVLGTTACGQNTTETEKPASLQVAGDGHDQLRKDIGEMLLVGFRGTSLNENNHIIRDITKYHVGNVILFEYDAPTGTRHRNISSPEQVKQLCQSLQKYAKGHLLIGIDQEGGKVTRLRSQDGFPKTLSAQESAQAGDKSVEDNAITIAQELSEAGINLNFAPCVDVNTNPSCPIIGKLGRSFSNDPERVAQCARIWIDVQQKAGIVSCLKHFPGHGSASGDTHAGLVDISKTWQESELEPYRNLIENGGVEMVMVAHVINQQMGDDLPASLSPTVVRDKLRNELGFEGVVVTDDLAMGAITKHYGLEEAVKMAILAGCDMLCLSNNGGGTYDPELVPRVVEAIIQMVNQGEISEEDIHNAAERIRTLKKAHSIK